MLVPMEGCKTFALQMCVRYGFSHVEKKEDYEIAHFLEHMFAFLTSQRYPDAHQNQATFSRLGIWSNAYTHPYKTVYVFRGLRIHLPKILCMLLHAYTSFRVDSTTFEQEREAVINELTSHLSNPTYIVGETIDKHLNKFDEALYGMTLATEIDNTRKLTQERLMEKYAEHYSGPSVLFCIAGGFDPAGIQRRFARRIVEKRRSLSRTRPPVPFCSEPAQLRVPLKASKTTRISVTWTMKLSWKDYPRATILKVLDCILTDGLDSRLYQLLRTKMGAVYGIRGDWAFNEAEEVMYCLMCDVEASSKVDAVLKAILTECECMKPITQEELESTQNSVRFVMEENNQKAMSPAFWLQAYADPILFNEKPLSRKQYTAIIANMQKEDITAMAKSLFRKSTRVVVIGVPSS